MTIFGRTGDKKKAAREWIEKGKRAATLEEKYRCYDRSTEIDPINADTWNKKGITLGNLKRYEEAIKCYERAIEINPNHVNAWDNKGDALQNLKRHEEAIRCYDKVIEIDPNHRWAWSGKGDTLQNLKRHEEAIRCYDKVIEIDPNHRWAWSGKGDTLQNLKRHEEAIRCYDRAIEIDPNNANAWDGKGNVLYSLNQYEEAMRCYDKAIRIHPNRASIWSNKGNVLYSLNQYKEAMRHYDKAIEIDPNKADAWSGKGIALVSLNRYEEAIRCYDRVIEIDPNSIIAWIGKGGIFVSLNRYDEAIKCYDRAIEVDPNSTTAWKGKGIALASLNRYDEAIKCYDRAIEVDPNSTTAWKGKGIALASLNRYDEAIKCYDRAIEINPDTADTKKNRELVLKEIGENAQTSQSTFSRSGEAGQPPQLPMHPGQLIGLRQSITIERTVYDPLSQDFIVSSSRPLVNVKDWIDRHDPNSYWLVICVHNHGDHAVDEWGIELDSSSSLRVLDAAIEGIDGQVHLMTSNPKPWLVRSILGISHHRGIVIPRDGSRRVYFRLGSESCGTAHTIQGRFITGSVKIPIREKTFTHSCDVATLRVALSKDPAIAEKYAGNIIRHEYDRDTALKLLRSLKIVQEIDQCCTLQDYDEILNRMQLLAGTLENIQAGEKLTRLVKQNCDALTILGDGEASAERAQRLCSNVIDLWINEFICMEDGEKHSFKSKSRERGEDAGKCPVCGSRLVWRRAQKNNELYRGCTNFDGGCRWNDRSY